MTNESKMLEEELLELTELADEIYEYLETHKDVSDAVAIGECPALFKAYLLNNYGQEEKARFICKRVTEKGKEGNDKRDRK